MLLDSRLRSIDLNPLTSGLNPEDKMRIAQIGYKKWLIETAMLQERRGRKVGSRIVFAGGKLAT